MDRRIAFRLAIVVAGMFLADDRRTASAWFVAGGVQDDWDRFYDCLIRVGRTSGTLATAILGLVVQKFAPVIGDRILLAMDDSPTARYGRHVEGAGVHHDPTPGPAGGEWLYGHNWVALAWLATHPLWGVIALPLRSMLYVRQVDVPKLAEKYGWEFRTKHQLGVELLTWFKQMIRVLGVEAKLWLAVDGAYAVRPFLLPVLGLGFVVVSRLRKDACLFDLPPAGSHGNRIYGKHKLSLANRAAHQKGWQTISYDCRGAEVTRQYKTFLATSQLVSGQIRVVIVRFEDGSWAPYFCTDTSAEVREILEAVAARWAIEEQFHDPCLQPLSIVAHPWRKVGSSGVGCLAATAAAPRCLTCSSSTAPHCLCGRPSTRPTPAGASAPASCWLTSFRTWPRETCRFFRRR